MGGAAAELVLPGERGNSGLFREQGIRRVNRRLLAYAYGLIPRLPGEIARLEALLRWAAGPVIAGVRPASLVWLPKTLAGNAWDREGCGRCAALGITALALREGTGGVLALIYRQGLLARKLRAGAGRRYLRSLGYPQSGGLPGYVSFLKKRFAGPGFPHEVGIFLGYPLEDVMCFSAGRSSPYACRGYWKVYRRPEKAERTFAYMDAARLFLMRELFSGSLPEDDNAFDNQGDRRLPLSAVPQGLKGRRVTM
jgi:hypothetical protein